MLKDKLSELLTKKQCVVGDAFVKMDKETQAAFCQIMASSVGDSVISKALSSEGLPLSRDAIRGHRHCFLEETKNQCKCFPGGAQ
jgi:hypothetical protein